AAVKLIWSVIPARFRCVSITSQKRLLKAISWIFVHLSGAVLLHLLTRLLLSTRTAGMVGQWMLLIACNFVFTTLFSKSLKTAISTSPATMSVFVSLVI